MEMLLPHVHNRVVVLCLPVWEASPGPVAFRGDFFFGGGGGQRVSLLKPVPGGQHLADLVAKYRNPPGHVAARRKERRLR